MAADPVLEQMCIRLVPLRYRLLLVIILVLLVRVALSSTTPVPSLLLAIPS